MSTKEDKMVMKDKRGVRSVGERHLFFYVAIVVVLIASIVMLVACDAETTDMTDYDGSSITDNNTTDGNTNSANNTTNNGESDENGDDIDNGDDENSDNESDTPNDDIKEESKKEMSIEVKDAFFIYDGLYHSVEIEGVPDGANIEYEGEHEYKNVGLYEIKATISADGYKDEGITAWLEIAKRKLDEDSISFEDKTFVWDGEAHSIEVSGEIPTDIDVVYTNNGQVEVGEYEIVASFDTHGNYEDIADMRATLRISERFYDVRFIDDGEDEIVIQVGRGKGITDMPIPTPRAGYTVKWEDKDLSEITENVTVHAEYTPIIYAISYNACDGINDVRNITSYTVEDAGTEIYDAHREGYRFVRWIDEDGNAVSAISAEWLRDIELSAEWEAEEYGIEYVLDGGDNDERNAAIYTVEDDGATLFDAHMSGYKFAGWYKTSDFSDERIESICGRWLEDVVLYAKWSLENYEISYALGGGENDARNVTGYTAESDVITLYDAYREYYIFCGWYLSEAFDGEAITVISGAFQRSLTLYAKWQSVFEVRDGEIVGYNYAYGDTVVIPSDVDGERITAIADGVLRDAKKVIIKAELAEIGANTFAGCVLLEELDIESKVGNIADGALKDCVLLSSLTLPYMGLTANCESDGVHYPIATLFGTEEKNGFYEVSMIPTKITGGSVDYDLNMELKRYIPNALKELTLLGGTVFGYGIEKFTSLERINVRCEEMRQFALRDCTGLKELTILGEVADVSNTALIGCESLEVVCVESESVRELVLAAIQKAKLENVDVDVMN